MSQPKKRGWIGDPNHTLYVELKDGRIIGDARKLGGQDFLAQVRGKAIGRYCTAEFAQAAVVKNLNLEGDWDDETFGDGGQS